MNRPLREVNPPDCPAQSGDPALLTRAGNVLRAGITGCRCQAGGQCPALDRASVRRALDYAAGGGIGRAGSSRGRVAGTGAGSWSR